MKLTTKVKYGLRAMCHVAHSGGSSTPMIARAQAIPSRYLEEIIGDLRRSGLVVGKRGPRGGYRLARSPEKIGVSEVVAALTTRGHGTIMEDPLDQISSLVEQRVDERLAEVVGDLTLHKLLADARAHQERDAAERQI